VNLYDRKQRTCSVARFSLRRFARSCLRASWARLYFKVPGTSGLLIWKAKQLVESGTKGRRCRSPGRQGRFKSIGVYQSVMTSWAMTRVKPISSNIQFTYIQNTNNKVQMSITQWYQDYPAASDFLNIMFGCASFTEGSDSSINIAGFCDKESTPRCRRARPWRDDRSCQQNGRDRQG
jgi:hypothetical protein